jgi:hypothetical protein
VLNDDQAISATNAVLDLSRAEDRRLDVISEYLTGTYPSSAYIPRKVANRAAGKEYAGIIARSRQPVLSLPVETLSQNLFVDGYRPARSADNAVGWEHWQANRMDARQIGVNRGAISFGAAYLVILPGEPVPAWRPVSARRMRAMFADRINDEWPELAVEEWVEATAKGQRRRFRLYDSEHVYEMAGELLPPVSPVPPAGASGPSEFISYSKHGTGVCPVVRFTGSADLDGACLGEVEPLIPLQQQIDAGTYYIEMAQQYAVHRQRWATGMAIPEDDEGNPKEPFDAAVDRLWVGEGTPGAAEVKFGEFEQTEVKPWLDAREAALRAIAIKSQTPPGYMLGEMANLSAEALAATEAPAQRRASVYRTLLGEAYEQAFRLDAKQAGDEVGWEDTSSQVVWRDTESRSLAQVADALGKMAVQLGIPPRALWEKVPGVTDQDLQAWEAIMVEDQRRGADLAARSFGVDVTQQSTTPAVEPATT